MIIFSTRSACHLVDKMLLKRANYTIEEFSDREIFIKINQDIKDKEVWVIASTESPAENLLELYLLLDALMYAGVKKINLFFLYFGYARQAMAQPGEARSAEHIFDVLKKFSLNKVFIMHAHAADILQKFMNFTNVIDFDFFCEVAKDYDAVAAPDKGAAQFAQHVADKCKKDIVFLNKMRPEHDVAIIESVVGHVAGKKILLIDDMISTGRTLIEACQKLKASGALEVSAAVTHGIFAPGSYEMLENGLLKNIYVTNTLDRESLKKVKVIDISHFIKNIIETKK